MQNVTNTAVILESDEYVGKLDFSDIQERLLTHPDRFRRNEDLADLLYEAACLDKSLVQVFFSNGYECLETIRGENGRFLPGISPFTAISDYVVSNYDGQDLVLEVQGRTAEAFALTHSVCIWTSEPDSAELHKETVQFERTESAAYVARIVNGAASPALVVVTKTCDGVVSEEDFE